MLYMSQWNTEVVCVIRQYLIAYYITCGANLYRGCASFTVNRSPKAPDLLGSLDYSLEFGLVLEQASHIPSHSGASRGHEDNESLPNLRQHSRIWPAR